MIEEVVRYMPQSTRKKLFELVYEKYVSLAKSEFKNRDKGGRRGRVPIDSALADAIGVSPITIRAWKHDVFQGCDENIAKLLRLALRLEPNKTVELLMKDVERHREIVEKLSQSQSSQAQAMGDQHA